MNRILPLGTSLILCTVFFSCQKNNNGQEGEVTEYISQVIEYVPAPGQFINTGLGNMQAAQGIVGNNPNALVSLGSFGGYITFRFAHAVENLPGNDFIIYGNAFGESSEQGAVMVAVDRNANGKPDPEEWYELAGSQHTDASTVKNYCVTYYKPSQSTTAEGVRWSDNQGGSGTLDSNVFHGQCYYPLFAQGNADQITFTGTLLKNTVAVENGITVLKPFVWGYADNYSADYREGDGALKNSNKFDIARAVDADGNPVALESIDFVRVYSAILGVNGALGEVSTEVGGAVSLHIKK